MSRWNPERWQQAGVNEAGDPVYVRGAGEEAVVIEGYISGPREPGVQASDDTSGLPPVVSVHDLSKVELQELLEQRGLPKSGNKDELIERLSA